LTNEPESVINCVGLLGSDWLNAVSVCHETAEVEMCAVVKAYFSADFNVYSDISDAETLENSSNQCSAMFSQICKLRL